MNCHCGKKATFRLENFDYCESHAPMQSERIDPAAPPTAKKLVPPMSDAELNALNVLYVGVGHDGDTIELQRRNIGGLLARIAALEAELAASRATGLAWHPMSDGNPGTDDACIVVVKKDKSGYEYRAARFRDGKWVAPYAESLRVVRYAFLPDPAQVLAAIDRARAEGAGAV